MTIKPTICVPQYMFKDKEVSPHTWIDIQQMQLDCYELGNHVALLIDPVTREYLYVFWDEAAQCSNPYPSYKDAVAACERYMQHLIGDALSQADEMNDNMRKYGSIDKPADI